MKYILIMMLSFTFAHATTLESKLKDFHKNPKKHYMKHIPKYDSNGKRAKDRLFKTRSSKNIAEMKMKYRDQFFKIKIPSNKFTAPPGENDKAKSLVDGANPIDNLYVIDGRGLHQSSLQNSPWSGDYWPIYQGILGNRFLDSSNPRSADWKVYYDYITQFNFFEIFKSGQIDQINELSVSEKYDLLTGDSTGSLTQAMWDQGREYYEVTGKVESWMGICHGWAAAAVMMSRPARSVQVLAFDGKTVINFNPSELKGLVSYLWANSSFPTRFVGGRCNHKDVKRDENGRPLAAECFDSNPATWFISIVNQIGINGRGFIMDATADYEVWNQPVHAYSFKYFNPQTLKESAALRDAVVTRAEYTNDKFKKYRGSLASHMVGIEMSVKYIVEENANDNSVDTPANDNIRTVSYTFDLELDKNGKVIGGEWYESNHPDFLWIPDESAQASTPQDFYLDESQWDGHEALPTNWRNAARSAAMNRRVLSSITNKLIQRAQ